MTLRNSGLARPQKDEIYRHEEKLAIFGRIELSRSL